MVGMLLSVLSHLPNDPLLDELSAMTIHDSGYAVVTWLYLTEFSAVI